jgi:hypothetical protein
MILNTLTSLGCFVNHLYRKMTMIPFSSISYVNLIKLETVIPFSSISYVNLIKLDTFIEIGWKSHFL